MKRYLNNITRKFDYVDESKYNHILNQSERTTTIPGFQKFLQTINQEDFFFYPNTEEFRYELGMWYGVQTNQIFLCAGSDVGKIYI